MYKNDSLKSVSDNYSDEEYQVEFQEEFLEEVISNENSVKQVKIEK